MDDELFRQTMKRAAHLCGVTTHSMVARLKDNREQAVKIEAIMLTASDEVNACMKLAEKSDQPKKPKVKVDEPS